jgi:hypothetical protein
MLWLEICMLDGDFVRSASERAITRGLARTRGYSKNALTVTEKRIHETKRCGFGAPASGNVCSCIAKNALTPEAGRAYLRKSLGVRKVPSHMERER